MNRQIDGCTDRKMKGKTEQQKGLEVIVMYQHANVGNKK